MSRSIPFAIAILLALATQSTAAFQLGDHKRITAQAVEEVVRCSPGANDVFSYGWILYGNLEEDLNVVKKGLFYSHYYHPHKTLDMLRYDSHARISSLQTNGVMGMIELGQTIHHLQDAAVPLHVLPIDHGLTDGFESYAVNAEITSGLSCEQIGGMGLSAPDAALKETALETLAALETESFEMEATKGAQVTRLRVTGRDFWREAEGGAFGDYGRLGNVFGETHFRVNRVDFRVEPAAYATYKQNRMKHAVRATIRALMWRLVPQLPSHRAACFAPVSGPNS
jgi:hypothetical protein